MIRTLAFTIALSLALTDVASAACYADYKAKKGDPLRLHYGVIELPDSACGDPQQAVRLTRDRIAAGGWTLLNVLSVFGSDQLAGKRESAGDFYLRY